MKPACLFTIAILSTGCSAIAEKADDLTTISIGADQLSAVQIDQSMTLGEGQLPACLPITITLPSSNITVAMQPTDAGCSLNLHQPDLVLLDQAEIATAREKTKHFDVDGVRSGSVAVEKLELHTADGAPLALSEYVTALSVQVDGQTLLDGITPAALEGETGLKRELPSSIIDKLKTSVKTNQSTTADVSVTLWLQAQTLTNLPGTLKMLVVLQPELEVNIIDAL